jgi:hypothetical protein
MTFSEHRHRKLMNAVAEILYLAHDGEGCWLSVPMWAKRKWMGKVRRVMQKEEIAWQDVIDAARGRGCDACKHDWTGAYDGIHLEVCVKCNTFRGRTHSLMGVGGE